MTNCSVGTLRINYYTLKDQIRQDADRADVALIARDATLNTGKQDPSQGMVL